MLTRVGMVQIVFSQLQFTRDELIHARNSLRFVAIELHNICGILDGVIERNGGPGPKVPLQRTPQNSRLPHHLDHVAVEKALKFAATNDIRDSRKVSQLFETEIKLGTIGVNQDTVSSFMSGLVFALIGLFLFVYDVVISVVLIVVSRTVSATIPLQPPSPLPGRSRSPPVTSRSSTPSFSLHDLLADCWIALVTPGELLPAAFLVLGERIVFAWIFPNFLVSLLVNILRLFLLLLIVFVSLWTKMKTA